MSDTRHHGWKAKDRSGNNTNWSVNEPKWWRRLCKHKKRRAAQRLALNKVMRGEDETLFPLDKKPWRYYW